MKHQESAFTQRYNKKSHYGRKAIRKTIRNEITFRLGITTLRTKNAHYIKTDDEGVQVTWKGKRRQYHLPGTDSKVAPPETSDFV